MKWHGGVSTDFQELDNIMRTLNEAPVSYREAPVMMGPATGGLGEDAKKPSLKLTFSHLNSWMVGILSRLPFGARNRPIFRCKLAGFVSGRHMTHMTYATGEAWHRTTCQRKIGSHNLDNTDSWNLEVGFLNIQMIIINSIDMKKH